MHSPDLFIQTYISTFRTLTLTEYMIVLSSAFDVTVFSVLITLLVASLVHMMRGKSLALLFLWVMSASVVVVGGMKFFFNIARPSDQIISAFGQSFPSYHATIATVFFIMLMYIFDTYLNKVVRIFFNTFCILMILLVSFSRVYLGVHWFSDVCAGIILGFILVYGSITIFKKHGTHSLR